MNTDHIPADKLREFIKDWREGIAKHPGRGDARAEEILTDLEWDFLTPSLPTLAAMTPAEREACLLMQADHLAGRCVIFSVGHSVTRYNAQNGDEHYEAARVLFKGGRTEILPLDELTPRPDLPPMVWPTSEPVQEDTPEPAPEQESNYLTTLNSSLRPGVLKPDPKPGEAWLVGYIIAPHEQFNVLYGFDNYAYDFQGNEWKIEDLIPLSRLVPESGIHKLRRELQKQVTRWEDEIKILEASIRVEAEIEAEKGRKRQFLSPADIAAGHIRSCVNAINRILAGETDD